jgi:hypothetical protein
MCVYSIQNQSVQEHALQQDQQQPAITLLIVFDMMAHINEKKKKIFFFYGRLIGYIFDPFPLLYHFSLPLFFF